jgi:O-acetyl-ADP-ribose deacetylase (regulator of RNase III)
MQSETMAGKSMQFLFGDRELLIQVQDLVAAPVEVIVNASNPTLTHTGGVASQIVQKAGQQVQAESEQLIKEYGQIDSGMAVYTMAGELPYKAVIHAVGPTMGEGDEQRMLELAVSRSLQLCEMNEWQSVAFPAISAGFSGVPLSVCSQAFFRAITRFWDARQDCVPDKILLCMTERNFQEFFDAFREEGINEPVSNTSSAQQAGESYGEVDLSDADIGSLKNDEIDDWFK